MSGFLIFYAISMGLAVVFSIAAFYVERQTRKKNEYTDPYTLQDLITLVILLFVPVLNTSIIIVAFVYIWVQSEKIVLFKGKLP